MSDAALVSPALAAARQKAADAKAAREAAALSAADAELLKLHRQIQEDDAAAEVSHREARALRGLEEEAEERKAAAGKYLVKAIDIAALLPGLTEEQVKALPGEGVIVVRSPPVHPTDALAGFLREIEAGKEAHPDIYAELVCESTVRPKLKPGTAEAYREFWSSSLGRGTVITVGDQVAELGGMRGRAAKRGR
jgi:hypothetical protein